MAQHNILQIAGGSGSSGERRDALQSCHFNGQ